MEHTPDNVVALKAACTEMNQAYADLAQGYHLTAEREKPFVVTADAELGIAFISIKGGEEWTVACVLGAVLKGELPVAASSYRKSYDQPLIG